MIVDYKNLVLYLIKRRQYPILLDYVIIDIYYKLVKPKSIGTRYSLDTNCPKVVFNSENKSDEIVYLTCEDHYFYVHKEKANDIQLANYPIKCIRVKIYKDFINKILNINAKSFEEEIYNFIVCLNFDIPKIIELLNISFIDSTRFVPDRIKLWVSEYQTKTMSTAQEVNNHFGPASEIFDTRLLMGKLSPCTSREIILSCRNAQGIRDDALQSLMPPDCDLYIVHYITDHKSFIPLAFNPLENPIVK